MEQWIRTYITNLVTEINAKYPGTYSKEQIERAAKSLASMGKSKEEAYYIIEQYQKMISEQEFDDEVLDEAIVFINTSKQASRIKCATIGWRGLKNLLDGKEVEE